MNKPPSRFVLVVLTGPLVLGCGAERYEHRFRTNTTTMFRDQAQLDQNLAAPWSRRGISLRVPKAFTEQSVPEGGFVSLRMPNGNQVKLPGILGVFSAELAAVTADGDTLEVSAGIAVLSNREFLESRGASDDEDDSKLQIKPEEFVVEVPNLVAQAIAAGAWEGRTKTFGGRRYQPTLRYQVFRDQMEGSQGIDYDVSLYLYSSNRVKVAILVTIPSRPTGDVPIETQIPLCLRTLRIEAPGTAASDIGDTDAPAGGGPKF